MPILTFPLVLALTTCFIVGSLVTWVLGERRRRMEREEVERQMTRALQTRYEVYEGLEQTVIKLVTKFDAMESEFKQRLTQSPPAAARAGAASDRSVRMRSANPELWDIEREHHRVTSEQLAEISRRSARITELMEQVQKLEPAKDKLEQELCALRQRFETAVANAAEFEQASHVKVDRLQARVAELEPLTSLLETARRDLAAVIDARQQALDEAARRQEELQSRIEQLAPLEERVQQLDDVVARRDSEVGESKLRILELEGEYAGAKQMLAKETARLAEFTAQASKSQQELASTKSQLDSLRASHDSVWKELESAKKELQQTSQRCEIYTTDLTKARVALDESRAQALSAQKAIEHSTARVAELEAELESARSQSQQQQARFDESLQKLEGQTRAAQARAEAAEFELRELRDAHAAHKAQSAEQLRMLTIAAQEAQARIEQLQAAHAGEQAEFAERMQNLTRELEQARAELTLHRAKLAAHSSHVVEAWSVLSELKPMLETLEQKLKDSDEPGSALPSRESAQAQAPAPQQSPAQNP